MKYNYTLHITDDYLYLKKKDNVIKYKLPKDVIYGGKIANINKFMKSLEKLLSENHLNNSLFGEKIKVIVSSNYTNADITYLKNILNCFNYRKISIDKELKAYKLNNTNAYVSVFDTYLNITFLDEYKKINNIYIETKSFFNTDDLMKYLNYITTNKEIYLLGSGTLINDIFCTFEEKFNKKTYIFQNKETHIITSQNTWFCLILSKNVDRFFLHFSNFYVKVET